MSLTARPNSWQLGLGSHHAAPAGIVTCVSPIETNSKKESTTRSAPRYPFEVCADLGRGSSAGNDVVEASPGESCLIHVTFVSHIFVATLLYVELPKKGGHLREPIVD